MTFPWIVNDNLLVCHTYKKKSCKPCGDFFISDKMAIFVTRKHKQQKNDKGNR